jgi:dephospho-CoA kinase
MTSRNSLLLGVTGGIACGKSEVGRILDEAGFSVLDTDYLAHKLMQSGEAVFNAVVERFGTEILTEKGEIDRAVLGEIVFADPDAREDLNALVHPAVIEGVKAWADKQDQDAAVLIPLLFEVGWTEGWDAVVCVASDRETIVDRLRQRGLDRAAAEKRIEAQMPLSEKVARADFMIENNASLDALRVETLSLVDRIREEKK